MVDLTPAPKPFAKSHRHETQANGIIPKLKQILTEEPTAENGWEAMGDRKGISLNSKAVAGFPTGILRGSGEILGFSPREVFAVVITIEARKKWDGMFEKGRMIATLDPSRPVAINYAATKGVLITSGRDMVLLNCMDVAEDGTIRIGYTSLYEEEFVPETSEKVRLHAEIVGWEFAPFTDASGNKGTRTTYIAQTDPKGWVPGAFLKMVSAEIPLCVANVFDYIKQNGSPPVFNVLSGELVGGYSLNTEGTYSWSADFKAIAEYSPTGVSELFVSKQSFPHGIDFTVSPAGSLEAGWADDRSVLVIKPTSASVHVKLSGVKRTSGDFTVTFEGKNL